MSGLDRFLDAQDGGAYAAALAELRRGRKSGHWMWFVFPQVAGLGQSPTAVHFGVTGLAEARAYVAHPVLGTRLREAAAALLELADSDPVAVLGSIDAMKLRSSMTLFEAAAPEEPAYGAVLDKFYAGDRDTLTLSILGRPAAR